MSFAQASKQGSDRSKVQCHRCSQFGHMSRNCKTVLDGQESKRGGSDDNESVGSGGGKAAWNFSQVERGVKWQRAMDDDPLHF